MKELFFNQLILNRATFIKICLQYIDDADKSRELFNSEMDTDKIRESFNPEMISRFEEVHQRDYEANTENGEFLSDLYVALILYNDEYYGHIYFWRVKG